MTTYMYAAQGIVERRSLSRWFGSVKVAPPSKSVCTEVVSHGPRWSGFGFLGPWGIRGDQIASPDAGGRPRAHTLVPIFTPPAR